jgi:hypothetical protein
MTKFWEVVTFMAAKEVKSKECENYTASLPHVHNKFEFGCVKKSNTHLTIKLSTVSNMCEKCEVQFTESELFPLGNPSRRGVYDTVSIFRGRDQ